jgi:hypothetical protein
VVIESINRQRFALRAGLLLVTAAAVHEVVQVAGGEFQLNGWSRMRFAS